MEEQYHCRYGHIISKTEKRTYDKNGNKYALLIGFCNGCQKHYVLQHIDIPEKQKRKKKKKKHNKHYSPYGSIGNPYHGGSVSPR